MVKFWLLRNEVYLRRIYSKDNPCCKDLSRLHLTFVTFCLSRLIRRLQSELMTRFQRSYVISMEFLSLRCKRLSCEMLLVVLFKTKYVQVRVRVWRDSRLILSNQKSVFMQLATTNLVPRVLSYPPWERGCATTLFAARQVWTWLGKCAAKQFARFSNPFFLRFTFFSLFSL